MKTIIPAGMPVSSGFFTGQLYQIIETRVAEGIVTWERNEPHPSIDEGKPPEVSAVDTIELLRGLCGRRVRVTIDVLE